MNQGKNSISVIIPAYNCASYLPDCLDSIIAQEYPVLEIIIVNDGSTDETQKIITDYYHRYPDLIVPIKQENKGAAAARNKALPLVKGDYISFIDGDDYIWKDYFQVLINAATSKRADLVTCGYQKFDTKTEKILETRDPSQWIANFGSLKHVFQYSPCAKIIKTDLVSNNNLRFVENEIMEDGPFGIMTNSIAQNNVTLSYLGYRYRVHDGSVQDGVRKEGLKTDNESRSFPYNGLKKAIDTVRKIRGKEYEVVLEYVICKALAGFLYSFSRNSTKEGLRFTCAHCKEIVDAYFPNMRINPYIKLSKPKEIPFTHRAALLLFKISYRFNILYPTARVVQSIEQLGKNHLK